MADPVTTPPPAAELPKPTNVLHYLVVYPTLLLALFGAMPTIVQHIKAWRLETSASKVQLVEEQQRLWERNLECLQQSGMYEVDGPHGIVVRVTLCASTGDTLLRYHVRDWSPIYRWVALPVEKVKQ
jgi:hypothetical protein